MAKTRHTKIDGASLEAARKRAGLSTTELAARLHIDERTWRRWVKAGRLPSVSLPAVTQHLRLELPAGDHDGDQASHQPHSGLVRAGVEELLDGQQEGLIEQRQILELVQEILARIGALEAKLDEQGSRRPARRRA